MNYRFIFGILIYPMYFTLYVFGGKLIDQTTFNNSIYTIIAYVYIVFGIICLERNETSSFIMYRCKDMKTYRLVKLKKNLIMSLQLSAILEVMYFAFSNINSNPVDIIRNTVITFINFVFISHVLHLLSLYIKKIYLFTSYIILTALFLYSLSEYSQETLKYCFYEFPYIKFEYFHAVVYIVCFILLVIFERLNKNSDYYV